MISASAAKGRPAAAAWIGASRTRLAVQAIRTVSMIAASGAPYGVRENQARAGAAASEAETAVSRASEPRPSSNSSTKRAPSALRFSMTRMARPSQSAPIAGPALAATLTARTPSK